MSRALERILADEEVRRHNVSPEQARAVLLAVARSLGAIMVRRGRGRGRGYGPWETAYPGAAEAVTRWAEVGS